MQHCFTVEVENRRALEMKAVLACLPAGNPYCDAYDEPDDVARAWVTALPRPSSRLDSVAFTEDVCAYLGAPIPACVAVRNTIVPQARGHDRRVGDYGGPLLSAQMDGLWDRSHRGLQRVVAADVRDHGGAATLEVGGLFAAAIEQLRASALPEAWAAAQRDGLVGYIPDIATRFPDEATVLWEAKVMHVNPYCYPPCSQPGGSMRPPAYPPRGRPRACARSAGARGACRSRCARRAP